MVLRICVHAAMMIVVFAWAVISLEKRTKEVPVVDGAQERRNFLSDRAQELQDVEQRLMMAVNIAPEVEVRLLGQKAGVLIQLGKPEEGMRLYERILSLDADDGPHIAADRIASLLGKEGYEEESCKIFEDLHRRLPDDPHIRARYALFLIEKRRQLDVAVSLLRKNLTEAPSPDGATHRTLGEAYLLQGDRRQARHYFGLALEKKPDDGLAAHHLKNLGP